MQKKGHLEVFNLNELIKDQDEYTNFIVSK